jgi:hypothetical protein
MNPEREELLKLQYRKWSEAVGQISKLKPILENFKSQLESAERFKRDTEQRILEILEEEFL